MHDLLFRSSCLNLFAKFRRVRYVIRCPGLFVYICSSLFLLQINSGQKDSPKKNCVAERTLSHLTMRLPLMLTLFLLPPVPRLKQFSLGDTRFPSQKRRHRKLRTAPRSGPRSLRLCRTYRLTCSIQRSTLPVTLQASNSHRQMPLDSSQRRRPGLPSSCRVSSIMAQTSPSSNDYFTVVAVICTQDASIGLYLIYPGKNLGLKWLTPRDKAPAPKLMAQVSEPQSIKWDVGPGMADQVL